MGIINLISTPAYLFILFLIAYFAKPYITKQETEKYYFPALFVKFSGAICLGLIYQFYYGGTGDTIGYYFKGGSVIWEAFMNSPLISLKLIFAGKAYEGDTFLYASRILTYGDLPTYFIVRISGVFSLLTFNSYYANALLFATLSFTGSWAFFSASIRIYPKLTWPIAITCLFVPSSIFWGSGILKDSITYSAVGWFYFGFMKYFVIKENKPVSLLILTISTMVIVHVKIYIALCLIPSFIIFLFLHGKKRIKNKAARLILTPLLIILAISTALFSIDYLGKLNPLYSLEEFTNRAEITATWLRYVGATQGGSYYSFGANDDFTQLGMVKKFIPAVFTTLYRPFIWEVKNPVMLMSALENLGFLLFTISVLFRRNIFVTIREILNDPYLFSFLMFSLLFAYAIGVSTYNFGSLVRYKIPMIPFYLLALVLLKSKLQSSTSNG